MADARDIEVSLIHTPAKCAFCFDRRYGNARILAFAAVLSFNFCPRLHTTLLGQHELTGGEMIPDIGGLDAIGHGTTRCSRPAEHDRFFQPGLMARYLVYRHGMMRGSARNWSGFCDGSVGILVASWRAAWP